MKIILSFILLLTANLFAKEDTGTTSTEIPKPSKLAPAGFPVDNSELIFKRKNTIVSRKEYVHFCYTPNGEMEKIISHSKNHFQVCEDNLLLGERPKNMTNDKNSVMKQVSCYDTDGFEIIVFSDLINACEAEKLLQEAPIKTDCTRVKSDVKTYNYLGEVIIYTEFKYYCGIYKVPGDYRTIQCTGKTQNSLKDCLSAKERFSLSKWKDSVLERKLKKGEDNGSGDPTSRVR